jgi:hypothetical protein
LEPPGLQRRREEREEKPILCRFRRRCKHHRRRRSRSGCDPRCAGETNEWSFVGGERKSMLSRALRWRGCRHVWPGLAWPGLAMRGGPWCRHWTRRIDLRSSVVLGVVLYLYYIHYFTYIQIQSICRFALNAYSYLG